MRIGILGCGYVGLELARQLVGRHEVTGVRRSALDSIRTTGATAVQADVTDPEALAAVPDADVLVFAASSGGRGAAEARRVYIDGLRTVLDDFADRPNPPDRLVYTSSTGVFGDHRGEWVDESTPIDPTTDKTRVLAEAERVVREAAEHYGIEGVVARFAGLYGPGRWRLDRYLAGPVTEGYLNMIHRVDAAGTLRFLIEKPLLDRSVVLVVDDEPVDKWEFADWLADQCGVDRPPKQTKADRMAAGGLSSVARRRLQTSKRCSNGVLKQLGYDFTYPTFREGYRAALDAYNQAGSGVD